MSQALRSALICLLPFLSLAGCVVYDPAAYTTIQPASFDRSWNAALNAAQDQNLDQRFTEAYNRRMGR